MMLNQIDQHVYQIYGLTEGEIRIMEGNSKHFKYFKKE